MRLWVKVGVLCAVAVATAAWFVNHELTRERSLHKLESRRAELKDALVRLQTNLNQEHLYWYYAFRQVEEPDDRAWDLAVRKVDSEVTANSNALARVEAQLARMRSAGGW